MTLLFTFTVLDSTASLHDKLTAAVQAIPGRAGSAQTSAGESHTAGRSYTKVGVAILQTLDPDLHVSMGNLEQDGPTQ